ncbi:MAG TPA: FecR family protein, partial [Chthoniobacterales bacterium]|nr:FecR family protein [Chthoniobacterales bacterium]
MMTKVFATALLLAASLATGFAGNLKEARINKIINEVTVVDDSASMRPAQLNDVIAGDVGVRTGIKSRSELVFQDETLTRVGPESYFSFKAGTRDMALKEGTMLLQVPKGLGGAKIRTAAVTAAITGTTIMLEHRPGKHIKVLVLEGSMRLSVNGTFGDSLLLLPGKMVIMKPDARRIPDPVTVDIAQVVKTSSLVKMQKTEGGAAPEALLPSMPLIQNEIDQQAKAKDGKGLVDTNLVILGGGTNVVMASDDALKLIDKRESIDDLIVASNPTSPGGGNGNGNNSGNGNGTGIGNGGPAPTPA